jgi:hypothetical protein
VAKFAVAVIMDSGFAAARRPGMTGEKEGRPGLPLTRHTLRPAGACGPRGCGGPEDLREANHVPTVERASEPATRSVSTPERVPLRSRFPCDGGATIPKIFLCLFGRVFMSVWNTFCVCLVKAPRASEQIQLKRYQNYSHPKKAPKNAIDRDRCNSSVTIPI